MSEKVTSIHRKLEAKRKHERMHNAAVVGAVTLGLSVGGGTAFKEMFDHEPKANEVMLSCLNNSGEVQTNVVVEFAGGTPYYDKPNVIAPNQFDQGNKVHELEKGKDLRIENFVLCKGIDGDEYVVTVLPTEQGSKPTDVTDFANNAVAFRYAERSYIGVADGKEPTERTAILSVDGLPADADQAMYVTHL